MNKKTKLHILDENDFDYDYEVGLIHLQINEGKLDLTNFIDKVLLDINDEYDRYIRLKMKYTKLFESVTRASVDLKFQMSNQVKLIKKDRIRLDMYSDYF